MRSTMLFLLVSLLTAPASATLIVYEPFDYAVGNLAGNVNPSNSQTWQDRRASTITASTTLQTQVVAGSLSYPGLAASTGGSVTYGTSVANTNATTGNQNGFNSSLKLGAATAINTGSVYYSFLVTLNGNTGIRASFASLSTDNNLGAALNSDNGTTGAMPAGVFLRTAGTVYEMGVGKTNIDAVAATAAQNGPSGTWQARGNTTDATLGTSGTPGANQVGHTNGQLLSDLPDSYFMVVRYTFTDSTSNNNDTVAIYVNPAASTFADNTKENGTNSSPAAISSYYAAVNGLGSATLDADFIRNFILNSHTANTANSNSVQFDELRIGNTWADVTPAAIPESSAVMAVAAVVVGLARLRKRLFVKNA